MCKRLQQESWIPSPRPSVLARHGILGVWGVVPSEAQKAALEAMARTIPGCTGVENRLISTESMSRNDKTV
jgi:osmotically-inducible protein OsmY